MPYLTYLECSNCDKPIPLRYSMHAASPMCPEWWPKDNQPVNFLCPSCRHVFEYYPSKVRRNSLEELEIPAPDKCQAVFSISKECVECNRESPVRIRAIMSAAANDPMLLEHSQEALKLLAHAIPVNILCEARQHLVTAQSLLECLELNVMVVADIGKT